MVPKALLLPFFYDNHSDPNAPIQRLLPEVADSFLSDAFRHPDAWERRASALLDSLGSLIQALQYPPPVLTFAWTDRHPCDVGPGGSRVPGTSTSLIQFVPLFHSISDDDPLHLF